MITNLTKHLNKHFSANYANVSSLFNDTDRWMNEEFKHHFVTFSLRLVKSTLYVLICWLKHGKFSREKLMEMLKALLTFRSSGFDNMIQVWFYLLLFCCLSYWYILLIYLMWGRMKVHGCFLFQDFQKKQKNIPQKSCPGSTSALQQTLTQCKHHGSSTWCSRSVMQRSRTAVNLLIYL